MDECKIDCGLDELKDDIKEIKKDVKSLTSLLNKHNTSLVVHEIRTATTEKRIERLEKGTVGLIVTALLAFGSKLFLS